MYFFYFPKPKTQFKDNFADFKDEDYCTVRRHPTLHIMFSGTVDRVTCTNTLCMLWAPVERETWKDSECFPICRLYPRCFQFSLKPRNLCCAQGEIRISVILKTNLFGFKMSVSSAVL